MANGWIERAGRFHVERIAVPHDVLVADMTKPPAGILHTTEGSWESALGVFTQHFAPNFMVGKDKTGKVRIAQFVPIGHMSAAVENHRGGVETNRWARAQIEIVGFSSLEPWTPAHDVCEALAALFLLLSKHELARIPLQRPFPDTLQPGVTWATESNPRRRTNTWGRVAGWYGHVEIPENSHWDAGSLQVREIFVLAAGPPRPSSYRIVVIDRKGRKIIAPRVKRRRLWMLRRPWIWRRPVHVYPVYTRP